MRAVWRKRKRKCLEAALFREVEAEAVMKKLMEAEAEAIKKINGSGSGSDKKLPLPDTLVLTTALEF